MTSRESPRLAGGRWTGYPLRFAHSDRACSATLFQRQRASPFHPPGSRLHPHSRPALPRVTRPLRCSGTRSRPRRGGQV